MMDAERRIIEHADELEQPDRDDTAAGAPPDLEHEHGDIGPVELDAGDAE